MNDLLHIRHEYFLFFFENLIIHSFDEGYQNLLLDQLIFYEYMIDGASDAIVEAYVNMESGELYYFETAGIGRSERNNNYMDDEYGYIFNKRYDMEGYQHVIACFKFVPDNTASAPTVFANVGGHPTTINRETKLLSADYPNYIEQKMNAAGMNFMFVQGAQSPISVNKGAVKTEEILALQAKWKTIGFAPQKMNTKIFERFRTACDDFLKRKADHFKNLKGSMNENLEKKTEKRKQ